MGNLAHGLMLRFVYLGDKVWCQGKRQPTTLFAGHEHCGSVHWLVFLIYLFYCFVCMRGRMGRGILSIPLNLFFWRRSFSLNLGNHSFSDRLEISEPQNIILRSILFFWSAKFRRLFPASRIIRNKFLLMIYPTFDPRLQCRRQRQVSW